MRIRSKSNVEAQVSWNQADLEFRHYEHGVLIGGVQHPAAADRSLVTRESSSLIEDEAGIGRGIKTCNHVKLDIKRFPTSSEGHATLDGTVDNRTTGQGSVWWQFMSPGPGGLYSLDFPESTISVHSVYSQNEAQQIADAIHDFYSGNNETSGFEDIIESPQLIDSMKSLSSSLGSSSVQKGILDSLFVKKAGSMVPLSKLATKARKRLLKRAAAITSGVYLAYSFGVAPLVSDIRKVSKAMSSLKQKMQSAKSSAGKLVSIHRSSIGALSYQQSSGEGEGIRYRDGGLVWTLKPKSGARRVVTVRGYRTQKYNTKVFSSLDYLLSRFGSSGPASLAWEFIPYSFVSDWFVDLRNITDKLDNLTTGSSKRIVDIGISEKYEYFNTAEFILDPSGNNHYDTGGLLYQSEVSHYHRKPVTSYSTVAASGRFGKKQATLLGALIHQKMANLL